MNRIISAWLIMLLVTGCIERSGEIEQSASKPLFSELDSAETGVRFVNELIFDEKFNIYTYRNYYNGGGVALGDVNNDGLLDIYLTGNLVTNRLYVNEGNLNFRDVTEEAGVGGARAWSTGVSMADVNGDGLLDIYVCNSGDIEGDNKQNELFLNNGDGTFSEQAEKYGLADNGFSTHAAFFDYDKDGDLDVYLLNNSYQAIGSFNLMQNKRPERDPVGGDKLFRNDGESFTDVSEAAGIYGSVIGFGLGVTVGDVNNDSWPDIFISNDFFERDYLYLNNGDGTFSEQLENAMRSVSAASMGADMADVNNDGHLDIFVTDMLPEPLDRIKQVTTFENWDKHQYNVRNNYHYQFTRNMLHLNSGDGTFIEIGRLAGVEATDWSWGALIFDMDNDGLKDLFVANGIYQDITDLDYLNFIQDDETKRKIITEEGVDYKGLIDPIPVNPISNYAYRNNGNFTFTNMAEEWGLGEPIHSNGSAYGDLDNDGDLDLVVNNVNAAADIFRNNATKIFPGNHYLRFRLKGKKLNSDAVGTRITAITETRKLSVEQQPTRGFESSVDPVLHLGLGTDSLVRELRIIWPDNTMTTLENVAADQTLELRQENADETYVPKKEELQPLLHKAFSLPFKHSENEFVDFDRDRLTYHMLSNEGPAAALADVNEDGFDDVFIGGARGYPAKLFFGREDGSFAPSDNTVFAEHERSEDTDAIFFDADGDGDMDLFVASGGNEYGLASPDLRNRLYINNGKGDFSFDRQDILGRQAVSTSVVAPADFDADGDIDLFLGTRLVAFKYGLSPDSYLLENDGRGNFTDVTSEKAERLSALGMVTDAVWSDVDLDGDPDLVIVGEWMAPVLFINNGGRLDFSEQNNDLQQYTGWYSAVSAHDIDADGDEDILLGNHGLNSRFRASVTNPLALYVADFDNNGSQEHIFAIKSPDGNEYPLTLKHELVMQMPSLKKKYLKFEDYRDQRLDEVFSAEQLKQAVRKEASEFRSAVLINNGDGRFNWRELPVEAQLAPVYAFAFRDLNDDGRDEVILGGNLYRVKPEAGRYDASHGLVLEISENTMIRALEPEYSGLRLDGEIRQILSPDDRREIIFVLNNDSTYVYSY